MSNTSHGLRYGMALAMVAGAIAAPSASALPIDSNLPDTNASPQGQPAQGEQSHGQPYVDSIARLSPSVFTPSSPADSAAVTADSNSVAADGFDWGDAGIGAVGMLALTAIAGGAALGLGLRHGPGSVA